MSSNYKFLTDQIAYEIVETKGGKDYYVTGYISTSDIDLYNDLVSEKCMKSMLMQIENSDIMLDYEHEVWRGNPTVLPVGKIVTARIDNKGLWVKAKLNQSSPKFNDLWGSLKGGFLKAFSIAFKPLEAVNKTIGMTTVRVLNDLQLLNVALTGAPVNPNATITDFSMKGIVLKSICEMKSEEINMTEEIKVEEKAEDKKCEKCGKYPCECKEENVEEKKCSGSVEKKASDDFEAKIKEMEENLKSMTTKIAEQEATIKKLNEQPVLKSIVEEPQKVEVKSEEIKSILKQIC